MKSKSVDPKPRKASAQITKKVNLFSVPSHDLVTVMSSLSQFSV